MNNFNYNFVFKIRFNLYVLCIKSYAHILHDTFNHISQFKYLWRSNIESRQKILYDLIECVFKKYYNVNK